MSTHTSLFLIFAHFLSMVQSLMQLKTMADQIVEHQHDVDSLLEKKRSVPLSGHLIAHSPSAKLELVSGSVRIILPSTAPAEASMRHCFAANRCRPHKTYSGK